MKPDWMLYSGSWAVQASNHQPTTEAKHAHLKPLHGEAAVEGLEAFHAKFQVNEPLGGSPAAPDWKSK